MTREEQRQLYTPDGLVFVYQENGCVFTARFWLRPQDDGLDILTFYPLSQKKINDNPVFRGVQLTNQQVRDVQNGECIYIANMKRDDGTHFSSYVVIDDGFHIAWFFQNPPGKLVKEDKYYIREMDKLLADNSFTARAKVRFWGPDQPESRQYFWRDRWYYD